MSTNLRLVQHLLGFAKQHLDRDPHWLQHGRALDLLQQDLQSYSVRQLSAGSVSVDVKQVLGYARQLGKELSPELNRVLAIMTHFLLADFEIFTNAMGTVPLYFLKVGGAGGDRHQETPAAREGRKAALEHQRILAQQRAQRDKLAAEKANYSQVMRQLSRSTPVVDPEKRTRVTSAVRESKVKEHETRKEFKNVFSQMARATTAARTHRGTKLDSTLKRESTKMGTCRVTTGYYYFFADDKVISAMKKQYLTHCAYKIVENDGVFLINSIEYRNAFLNTIQVRLNLPVQTLAVTLKTIHGHEDPLQSIILQQTESRPRTQTPKFLSSMFAKKKETGPMVVSQLDRDFTSKISAVPVVPRRHQNEIALQMQKPATTGLVLYHEAGTGKTFSAMATAIQFLLDGLVYHPADRKFESTRRVIITAPKSVEPQWQNEIKERINPYWDMIRKAGNSSRELEFLQKKKFTPQSPLDFQQAMVQITQKLHQSFLILGHDQFHSQVQSFETVTAPLTKLQKHVMRDPTGATWETIVIVDEAHNLSMKPVTFEKSRAMMRTINKAKKLVKTTEKLVRKKSEKLVYTEAQLQALVAKADQTLAQLRSVPQPDAHKIAITQAAKKAAQKFFQAQQAAKTRERMYTQAKSAVPMATDEYEVVVHMSKSILDAALLFATKFLFLTATPITKDLDDIYVMLKAIIIRKDDRQRAKMRAEGYEAMKAYHGRVMTYAQVTDLKGAPRKIVSAYTSPIEVLENAKKHVKNIRLLKEYINFQQRSTGTGDYPTALELPAQYLGAVNLMDKAYAREYLRRAVLESKDKERLLSKCKDNTGNAHPEFMNKERLASVVLLDPTTKHSLKSPKTRFVLTDEGHPENNFNETVTGLNFLGGSRTVIYTYYRQVAKFLKSEFERRYGAKVHVNIIGGHVETSQRRKFCNEFNEKKNHGVGEIMIIMPAGAEGLDLKLVNNVVFFDDVWTPSEYDQIMGRGVRYRSHVKITDPAKRVVKIWTLYNLFPDQQSVDANTCMRNVRAEKEKITTAFKNAFAGLPP